MSDINEIVKNYYNNNAKLEWERLIKRPFEFILTAHMMDKYIKSCDSILDIGGGPGRYSIYYASKGCDVTLIDLSEENVELAKKMAKKENVTLNAFAGDCLEPLCVGDKKYDHVFLMGPLYHLQDEKNRIKAVKNALDHLKEGGKIYISFILTFAGIMYDLENSGFIEDDVKGKNNYLFDCVENNADYCGDGFTGVYFYSPTNIAPFMERFNLTKLNLFGQEGILAINQDELLKRSKGEIATWIQVAKRYLEKPEFINMSEHAMYIGQK